jgi:hypothetical protein
MRKAYDWFKNMTSLRKPMKLIIQSCTHAFITWKHEYIHTKDFPRELRIETVIHAQRAIRNRVCMYGTHHAYIHTHTHAPLHAFCIQRVIHEFLYNRVVNQHASCISCVHIHTHARAHTRIHIPLYTDVAHFYMYAYFITGSAHARMPGLQS